MKKTNLVLFPVLGALLLAGCTTTKKSSKKKKSSNAEVTSQTTSQGGGGQSVTSQGGGGGGGTSVKPTSQGGGGGGGGSGGNGTVTLKANADKGAQETNSVTFTNDGYTVLIEQGSNTQNTIADCVNATGTNSFRMYKAFDVTFSAPSAFTKLEIQWFSFNTNPTQYAFNFDHSDATSEVDETNMKTTVTLKSAATSIKYANIAHQARVDSVKFIA